MILPIHLFPGEKMSVRIRLIVCFWVFVACAGCTGFKMVDADELSKLGGAQALRFDASAAGPLPAGFGAALQNSRYNGVGPAFRALPDGAREAHRLGLRTLKIAMAREARNIPGFYSLPELHNVSQARIMEVQSLTEMARLPVYDYVLSLPFDTLFIHTSEIGEHDPNSHFWNLNQKPLSAAALSGLYQEHYDFTRYLMEKFRGTGRKFVLQDHEADWHASVYDPATGTYSENTDIGHQNYRLYWSTRQKAVEDARRSLSSDVKVYQMCEVVRLRDSVLKNGKSLARDVLSTVTCDLVGYSAHDTAMIDDGGATLKAAVEYIRARARPSPTFGTNQVIISEIAVPEALNGGSYLPLVPQVTRIMADYLKSGMPWVLSWQFYDEPTFGNWLVKPDNGFSHTFLGFMAELGVDPLSLSGRTSSLPAYVVRAPTSSQGPIENGGGSGGSSGSGSAGGSGGSSGGGSGSGEGSGSGSSGGGGPSKPLPCKAPTSNYQRYFCATYQKIFAADPAETTLRLFEAQYDRGALGCVATIRDLMKEDPLRHQAADVRNRSANQSYIAKMYHVAFGRGSLPGDSPATILRLREDGYSLDQVDAIFFEHPETASRCASFGLRMFGN